MSGESFCLYLPRLDGECFEIFVRELNRERIPGLRLCRGLGRSCRTQKQPGELAGEYRGVAAPTLQPRALNPVERYFQELRARLSNRVFETIEEIMEALRAVHSPPTGTIHRC